MQFYYISEIYKLMGGDGVLLPDTVNGMLQYTASSPIGLRNMLGEDRDARKALIAEAMMQYDPKQHEINSKAKRPDKKTYIPNGQKDPITGEDKLELNFQPVARIPLQMQKYIIKQKASFARGNGVKLKPSDADSEVFNWVYNNWYANKTDNDLRDIFIHLKAETQCAVVFFSDTKSLKKAKNEKKASLYKLKHKILCPSKGSILYPYFDPETESLVALMREYENSDGKTVYDVYMEADPDNGRNTPVLRRFSSSDLESYSEMELPYPKLPLVYWGNDYIECDDSKELIEEMEKSFSDFTDQMGYSADPLLFGKGKVLNLPAKGTAGKFIEGSEDADLKYVTPENATEARELHFNMLQKWIFSLNRAVVLDIETMSKLSEVSGAAIERMLMDCFLEATDNQTGYWGKGVQRMVNVQLAVAKDLLNVPDDETTIDVEFTRYRVNDIRETVEVMMIANGNKPLIDHQESITAAGLVDDPKIAFERIQEQQDNQSEQNAAARMRQEEADRQPPESTRTTLM